ncbi:uncharacterized protein [Rutidosis leptorrhynchoides]|uniref:uncharacterized protein isoform X4 n=1 Tax=Rutidosis leptorrhynchoides TaxID=125765 RepID=UPI003A99525D
MLIIDLQRGPRYFDPPDNSWGNCYNCSEGGHTAANCTSAKRKKPCFVCGSFEHNVKECSKGKVCFICKKGHEMITYKAKYSRDDLKCCSHCHRIHCYLYFSIGLSRFGISKLVGT